VRNFSSSFLFSLSLLRLNSFLRPPPDLSRSAAQAPLQGATAPAPVPAQAPIRDQPLLPVNSDEESASADDGDNVIELEVDEVLPVGDAHDGEPPARRRRVTRKYTLAIFFEQIHGTDHDYFCKVGCLSSDTISRKLLKIHNSGHFVSHLSASHSLLLTQFRACERNIANFNAILGSIDILAAKTAKTIENNRKNRLNWNKVVAQDLAGPAKSNLLLMMWQIANGIGRLPANCPIFDLYLRSLGNNPAANRNTLQDDYLPLLSSLVVDKTKADFSDALSVSLSSDGWRSRTRQDFVNVTGGRTKTLSDRTWKLQAAELDIIHISGSCTADTLETLIASAVEEFVLFLASFVKFSLMFKFSYQQIALSLQ